ncbi:uncharacterized protein LOC128258664 [Drosophila gunungcola]|uniref:uncharacterized protein LOC128258664 n=1 Tax=Drosophila gunungcola TaxID=103775 RepID=UPI0022E161E6|nr:uncharacterized protein LOC128258664 [Drosophila gunungcola]
METSIQVPKELESLLSCGLCNRVYDLATNVLPRELICRHSYCEECLARSTLCDPTQCICPLCGIRTELYGQKLPESVAIMYLLRELPALVLGRAMLDFSEGNSRSIEVAGEQPESQSENWLDEICVDSFLATSAEHCFIHAMPNSTWCHDCQRLLCRACSDAPTHREHRLTHQLDYHELLRQLLDSELAKIKGTALQATELANREMDLLRQMCEACFHVQLHVKRMMLEHEPSIISATMTGWQRRAEQELNRSVGNLTGANLLQVLAQLAQQRRKFEVQLVEVHFQCRMRAAVQENGMQILDFEHLNDRILRLRNQPRPGPIPANVEPPQALILTNYCVFAYWNAVQRQMIPPRVRTPPSEPELLPQSGRAVVPPHFNHSLQEAELSQQMQQVEQDQDRLINLAAEEDSPGSSYSQSSSNSDSQSSLSAGPQVYTYVLVPGQHGMVPQFQDQMWQGPYEVQEQPPPLLQHQFQADNAWLNGQQNQNHNHVQSPPVGIVGQPSAHFYPIYFLDMEIAGELAGRVLIEVRSDVAPRMAENFRALVRHERGYGYQGCAVFQAWGRESIITGDFETHNGRGGHSAFENRYFMPDETGLPARRGTVGMRRGQRRQDRSGLVGSQFRLVLNEMRSFTAIFGYIVQGIELVDRIAASGNALGRPSLRSIIRNCGEYQLNN